MARSDALPPPGYYPDPAGSGGTAYWDGEEWSATSPSPKRPLDGRTLTIAGSVLAGFALLGLLGNCDGPSTGHSESTTTTVTTTVTTTYAPSTVTVTESPPATTVTETAEAPALTTEPWEAPEPSTAIPTTTPESAPGPGLIGPLPSSTYYGSCAEARAAGAAPLRAGEPGYRPGLDRDGDGVACES